MKLLLVLLLSFSLFSFTPKVVTPYPVLGFQEIPLNERSILAWYPVSPAEEGKASNNPWDLFFIAPNSEPTKSKKPVIILSHGYSGNPHQLSWLIKGLVYHGFIVLAIQHRDLIEGKAHINHWQRPKDIHLVLDHFEKSSLAQYADLQKIGIAGFSLGGTTAIWIAGGRATKLDTLIPTKEYSSPDDYIKANEALPTLNKEMMSKDYRDSRVKAAFIMAPAWSWLFEEKYLKQISIPVYLIAAENDKTLVTKNNAGFFARNIPHSVYQTIKGQDDHYLFISLINEKNSQKKVNAQQDLTFLFKDDTQVDREWIQRQVIDEAVRFFNTHFEEK